MDDAPDNPKMPERAWVARETNAHIRQLASPCGRNLLSAFSASAAAWKSSWPPSPSTTRQAARGSKAIGRPKSCGAYLRV